MFTSYDLGFFRKGSCELLSSNIIVQTERATFRFLMFKEEVIHTLVPKLLENVTVMTRGIKCLH